MGELHGYGIVLHILRASDDLLRVEEGSLYPALHRMEQKAGSVRSGPSQRPIAKQSVQADRGRQKVSAGGGKRFRTSGPGRSRHSALRVRGRKYVAFSPCFQSFSRNKM